MTFKGWHLPVTIALSPPPKEGWIAVCYMYCLTQSWGTSGRFQSQHCRIQFLVPTIQVFLKSYPCNKILLANTKFK